MENINFRPNLWPSFSRFNSDLAIISQCILLQGSRSGRCWSCGLQSHPGTGQESAWTVQKGASRDASSRRGRRIGSSWMQTPVQAPQMELFTRCKWSGLRTRRGRRWVVKTFISRCNPHENLLICNKINVQKHVHGALKLCRSISPTEFWRQRCMGNRLRWKSIKSRAWPWNLIERKTFLLIKEGE